MASLGPASRRTCSLPVSEGRAGRTSFSIPVPQKSTGARRYAPGSHDLAILCQVTFVVSAVKQRTTHKDGDNDQRLPSLQGQERLGCPIRRVLGSWHIFNPNGPTSNCIGFVDTDEPSIKEVFYRWLHFLHDESYTLGFVDLSADPLELVPILQNAILGQPSPLCPELRMVTCIPSLITRCEVEAYNDAIKKIMMQAPALQGADWGQELYYLRKYDRRLFDRAGEEVRESLEQLPPPPPDGVESQHELISMTNARHAHIPTFIDWELGQYTSAPFSAEAAETWYSRVTDHDYVYPGLVLLARAWVGAQYTVRETLPATTALDDVKEFFARFDHPLFHDSVTGDSVAADLGLI